MSTPGPITVVVRWHMSGERVEKVLGLVAQLRPKTLAEPGCLGYDVFQSVDQPGDLLLLERYRNHAAIAEHRGTTHYQELVVQRILPLLSDRKVELLRALDQV